MANLLVESVIVEKVSDSSNTSTLNLDMSKNNSLKEPSTPEKLPLQYKLPNIPNNLEKNNLGVPQSLEITLTDKNYIAKLKKDESCLSVSLNHSDKNKNVGEDFDIAVALPHKPLQGVIAFVDVRAEHENRSKAVSRELEKLGATISEKFTKNVTHVVFKDGRPTTFSQVRKCLSVYFVSVLWVDSCKSTMSWVNEALFPAKVPQYMESPCPLARVKRIKSLQPKSFEDEFSNSARKDERRRRRFNKINKDVDITPDHIICLDSQEYIKSSDLYKLVATPRPVPDTPWMLNYINGSSFSNIESELVQEDIQCKLNFENEEINMSHNGNEKNMLENDDGKNMVHDSDEKNMVHNSDDKKKKSLEKQNLEIDFFGRRFSQRLSCLKNLNASPSEESCSSPSKKLCNTLEKMFSSVLEKPYSSIKPDVNSTNTIVDLGISAKQVCSFESLHTVLYSKNVSKEQFNTKLVSDDLVSSEKKSIESQNYCSRLQNATCSNIKNGKFSNKIATTEHSKNESNEASDLNDISMDTSKFVHKSVNCVKKSLNCENSTNKRKKLLSRAKLTPQDKLINPRIKKKKTKFFEEKTNDSGHGNDSGHVFMENPNVKFDTYKALQNLEERKKIGNSCSSSLSICHVGGSLPIGQCFEKLFSTSYLECHLSQLSVDSTITAKHCAKPSSTSKTSKCHTVSCNINESLDMKDRLQKNDFLLSRSSERLKSLQRRSSGVDFEISKKFRKTLIKSTVSANIQTVKERGSADKPISVTDHNMESKNLVSNISEEMINNKKLSSDEDFYSDPLDSSFVHDENAGLIVPLKQKQESIRFHTLPESTRDNDSGISDGEVGSDVLLHSVQSSTQSNNVSSKLKASLVATSLHFSEHDFFKTAAKHLGGFQLRTNVVADTTHVVSGSGRRTLNVLRAIIKGCWLLSPKWVSDSYDKGKWLPEDAYELTEDYPVAQISRTQRISEGRSRHAVLFSSFLPIYLAETTFPSHEEMEKLILECGGRLTTSLRKAGIGIGHIRCRRQDFCAVSEKWLLDSISNGQVMPTRSYEIQTLNRDESPDF